MSNRKKINDTSNIKTITEVIEEKKDIEVSAAEHAERLVEENTNLCIIINNLKQRLQDEKSKVNHLEEMLSKSVPLIGGATRIVKPDEKQIAELQLDMLKQKAMKVELTLEEARKFEIFSKVKMNLDEKAKDMINPSYENLPTDDNKLLAMASSNIKKLESSDE